VQAALRHLRSQHALWQYVSEYDVRAIVETVTPFIADHIASLLDTASLITLADVKGVTGVDWARLACRAQAFKTAAEIAREAYPQGDATHSPRMGGAIVQADGPHALAPEVLDPLNARLTAAEAKNRDLEDLLGSIWLYIGWHYVTKQLTTAQKDLFADAIEASSLGTDVPVTVERWWRDNQEGHDHD